MAIAQIRMFAIGPFRRHIALRKEMATAITPSCWASSTGSSSFLQSPRPQSLPTRPEVAAACRGSAAPTAR
eukprot:12309950-Alexandrium_andersonii.AAC.1